MSVVKNSKGGVDKSQGQRVIGTNQSWQGQGQQVREKEFLGNKKAMRKTGTR